MTHCRHDKLCSGKLGCVSLPQAAARVSGVREDGEQEESKGASENVEESVPASDAEDCVLQFDDCDDCDEKVGGEDSGVQNWKDKSGQEFDRT